MKALYTEWSTIIYMIKNQTFHGEKYIVILGKFNDRIYFTHFMNVVGEIGRFRSQLGLDHHVEDLILFQR